MSYKYLTVEEMIEVSRRWVTPAGSTTAGKPVETDRPLLEGVPLLSALLPGATNLLGIVEERIAKGRRLGELEDAEARALSSPSPKAPSQYALVTNWIHQAQTLERLASSPRVPAEVREALLAPLRRAEQRALARLAAPEPAAPAEPKP
jgi:hypothetical protein